MLAHRSIIGAVVACIVATALVSCGADAEQDAAKTAHENLPPRVREMIRSVMLQNVNPAYTTIWRFVNRGDLEHIPALAERLKSTSEGIGVAMGQSEETPRELIELYDHMAMQADSIGVAARANDLPAALAITTRLKRQTCDGCHAKYQIGGNR